MIDTLGYSTTSACKCCRSCWLVIKHPEFAVSIVLRDFHLRRGNDPGQRPLADLRLATTLAESLSQGRWPSTTLAVEYGISTKQHLTALQHAVRAGVTAYDLDRVMGDGPAITQLVDSVPDQPFGKREFRTAYDDFDWGKGRHDWD